MRSRIGFALASILVGSTAFAQGIIDPYGQYAVPPPPPPPAVQYAQPPAAQPQQQTQAGTVIINIQQAPGSTQQVAPAPVQQPLNPYGPGYYYPPPGYAAPIYSYPPPNYQYRRYPAPVHRVVPAPRRLSCGACGPSVAQSNVRARFFSIGGRFTAMGINQEINGQDVALGGMGLQMRFRTRGRFGIEAGIDFLRGEFKTGAATPSTSPSGAPPNGGTIDAGGDGNPSTTPPPATGGGTFHIGDVTRDSVPFNLSALLYIFPNDDNRIFNLYFMGGVGVVGTRMSLLNQNGERVNQDFTEYSAHLGIGAELRFKWFAIDSSFRAVGLSRDDSEAPAAFYTGVEGAPVPKSSVGYQGTIAASLWF